MSAISLLRTDPRIQVREAAEKEWELFSEERSAGIEEVSQLRQRVAEEEARRKNDKEPQRELNVAETKKKSRPTVRSCLRLLNWLQIQL